MLIHTEAAEKEGKFQKVLGARRQNPLRSTPATWDEESWVHHPKSGQSVALVILLCVKGFNFCLEA